jgi:hypothetical protein
MRAYSVAIVFAATLATSALACGDAAQEREARDPSSVLEALKSPTGTFSEASAKGAFASYRSRRGADALLGESLPAPTDLRAASVRPQAEASGVASFQCKVGGTVTLDYEPVPNSPSAIRLAYEGCSVRENVSVTGRSVTLTSQTSLLGITLPLAPADTRSTHPDASFVTLFDGSVSRGSETVAVSSSVYVQANYAFVEAETTDGHLVIGVTGTSPSYKAVVLSRAGTWHCDGSVGGTAALSWTCTDDNGKSVSFAEDAEAVGN